MYLFAPAEIKAGAPDTLEVMHEAPGRLAMELMDAREAAAADAAP